MSAGQKRLMDCRVCEALFEVSYTCFLKFTRLSNVTPSILALGVSASGGVRG